MKISLNMLAITLALAAAPLPALAHSYKFGDIEVGHLWGPPTSGTETDVFGPLFNAGTAGDALVSVSSPDAAQVDMRDGTNESASGKRIIDLPPGKPVSLASWGIHLRLVGLAHPLKEGDWVPVTLVFKNAGAHDAKVLIEKSPSD